MRGASEFKTIKIIFKIFIKKNKDNVLLGQIKNLRLRLNLIKWMQVLGVVSLFMSIASTLFIYLHMNMAGSLTFILALVGMIVSLALSIWEIQISVVALNLHIKDMEE